MQRDTCKIAGGPFIVIIVQVDMNGGLTGDDDIEIDDDKYANPETEVLWYMAREIYIFNQYLPKLCF